MKKEEISYNNELRPFPKRKKKKRSGLVYILVLLTLFCISFSVTAFIIINANKLTFISTDLNPVTEEEIAKLKEQLAEKDEIIDDLTLELNKIRTGNTTVSSPAPTSSSTPSTASPTATPASSSPSPSATPKPSATPSASPTASPTPRPSESVQPTAAPSDTPAPPTPPNVDLPDDTE